MKIGKPQIDGKDRTVEDENRALEERILIRSDNLTNLPQDVEDMKEKAEKTLDRVQTQTGALFVLGFVLILTALIMLIASVAGWISSDSMTSLEIFGIGTLGVADLFGLLFYKPLEEAKRAMQDFAQTVLLTQGWLLSMELILRGVDIKNREMTMKAGALIQKVTAETVESLERFLSSEESE